MSQYKNIDRISGEQLLSLARKVLIKSPEFIYIKGVQPFIMIFKNQKYYVYIKNISSAYFADRDKVTRAQLPMKPEFDLIKSSPHPFIFLGYDSITDVYVCWNYNLVKKRLNNGESVSFYSRTFFQAEVKEGEFLRKKLKNGDFPVLFKRSNLIDFFLKIDTFFPNTDGFFMNNTDYSSNLNLEEKFIIYLKTVKKFSLETEKDFTNSLNNQISKAIQKYYLPKIKSIFYLEDLSLLEQLYLLLHEKDDFKLLNKFKGNLYTKALENYIGFIKFKIQNEPQIKNLPVENQQKVNGKLLKIVDQELLYKIEPLVRLKKFLEAAQIVGNHYYLQYPDMELFDWLDLVKRIENISYLD
jgi:hypothetical protein